MRLLEERVAVITGSAKGNGRAMANLFSEQGANVVVTGRDKNEIKSAVDDLVREYKTNPLGLQVDVSWAAEVKDMIDRVRQNYGRIDVLVNNAGYDLMGALEETSMDEIKAQFETNFFGAVRVMQAVIPLMRKQGGGIIVNITSLGGRMSFPLNSPYHATKFALEGLSESIQYELEPSGIKIIVIEPGGVGSNFLKNLKMAAKTSDPLDSPYRLMQSSMSEYFKQWSQNLTHPSEVAKVILQAVNSDNPDFRYIVGKDAVMALESRRNMSDREFQNLIKKQINL